MLASVMFSIAYCLKYFHIYAIAAVHSNPVFRQFVPLHGHISKSVLLKISADGLDLALGYSTKAIIPKEIGVPIAPPQ